MPPQPAEPSVIQLARGMMQAGDDGEDWWLAPPVMGPTAGPGSVGNDGPLFALLAAIVLAGAVMGMAGSPWLHPFTYGSRRGTTHTAVRHQRAKLPLVCGQAAA
jgi:hypothetical protein